LVVGVGGESFVVAETGAADFLIDRGELEVPTDVKIGHVPTGIKETILTYETHSDKLDLTILIIRNFICTV
jgi:hypothetical protein